MVESEIKIREAYESDIVQIIKVNRASLKTDDVNGLIQERSYNDFLKLMRICKHFLVAEINNRVVAYAILLDEEAPYPENEIFSYYPIKYSNFVFIDQVATHPDYRRKGVARKLYEKLLANERKRILADFLIAPLNHESIAFHKRLGFRSIGDKINLKSGMIAEIYEYHPK